MEKFKLEPNERILMEGALFQVEGEGKGAMDFLTGKSKMIKCGGILTDKRFVAWEKPQVGPPLSPLIWLIARIFKGRPIRFAIPLAAFTSIDIGPGTGFTLKAGGAAYRIASDGFFDQRDQWLKAISEAVTAACPGKQANRSEKLLEFVA